VTVTGLDHVVFRVADVERSLAFYVGTLGLEPVRVDEWRAGAVLFPSARIDAHTIIDILPRELAGDEGASGSLARNVDHVCLVVEPCDLQALADSATFDVVSGPGERFGAQGQGQALYVRDPDDNLVELRHYGPAS
jgi:catechol 2,3-dioxygenase-like lactoylglutathione lyase family enzyme